MLQGQLQNVVVHILGSAGQSNCLRFRVYLNSILIGMPVVFKITNLKLFGQKFLDTLKILYLSSGGHEKVDPIIPKQQVKAIASDLEVILTLS